MRRDGVRFGRGEMGWGEMGPPHLVQMCREHSLTLALAALGLTFLQFPVSADQPTGKDNRNLLYLFEF